MARDTRKTAENWNDTLPSRLRKLLDETETSQKKLGEVLGTTPQNISLYATGGSKPDWKTIVKIAEYFHVSTDWLLGLPGSVQKPDPSLKNACEYTGLSEASVQMFHELSNSKLRASLFNALDYLLGEDCYDSLAMFGEAPIKIPRLLSTISAFMNAYFPEQASICIYDDGRAKVSADPAFVEEFYGDDNFLKVLDLKEIQLKLTVDEITDSLRFTREKYQKLLGHSDFRYGG